MGNYGVKILKSGYNINETSLDKYNFHSAYPLLKIKSISTGYAQVVTGAERLVATIAHNLGYAPMFDVLIGFNNTTATPSTWYSNSYYVNYPGLGALHYMKIYSDSTNLYIYCYQNDTTNYCFYKAVIYYDPINP